MIVMISYSELLAVVKACNGTLMIPPKATEIPRINWIVDNLMNYDTGEEWEPYDDALYKAEVEAIVELNVVWREGKTT